MAKVNYNRLVALGCSHTYGHGLEDCFIPPKGFGTDPSKLAWPSQLAKMLNIESVVNLSKPGCSNKYMLHSALNFEFDKNDLVVALWTYNNRTGIFKNSSEYRHIGHWSNNKYSKKFLKSYYTDYDNNFQNIVYTNYFFLYAKSKCLNYYYDFIESNSKDDLPFFQNDNFVDLKFDEHSQKYPTALDGSHMGSQGHLDYAKQWYQFIDSQSIQQ